MSRKYNISIGHISPWVHTEDIKSLTRKVQFQMKLKRKVPLLPQVPQVEQEEFAFFDKAAQVLVVDNVIRIPNMPQGDKFTACARVIFRRIGDCSECSVSYETRFSSFTMLKPAISTAALQLNHTQW